MQAANGVYYFSWSGRGTMTNILDPVDPALALTGSFFKSPVTAWSGVQQPPRQGDRHPLPHEPSGRGEPVVRHSPPVRDRPGQPLSPARQPPAEAGTMNRAWLMAAPLAAALLLGLAILAPPLTQPPLLLRRNMPGPRPSGQAGRTAAGQGLAAGPP